MESTSSPAVNVSETAAGSQTKAILKAGDMHNIRACLSTSKLTRDCDEMIEYLKRSRILTAITKACTAYASHQQEFWQTAVYDEALGGIRGSVKGNTVLVSEEMLNDLLEFGDSPTDPIYLNIGRVKGCLLRCGYSGEIRHESVYKTKFCPSYRYLMHVISHCLGPRRTGHDQLNQTFSHLFVALVLNVKFNISRAIFNCLKENLSKKDGQFLMYPRFLQILIDAQVEGLAKEDGDKIKLKHMNDQTVRQMSRYMGSTIPPKRRLICHLANPDYKAPEKKYLWRNEDSTSQVENIEVVSDDDDDDEAEVQSQVAKDPTGGEDIPTGLDDVYIDDLFDEADEDQTRKRKEKAVAEEPEKKKKKAYKYKPLVQSTSQAAPATATTTTATAAATTTTTTATTTATGSQLPNVNVDETLSKLQSYMLDMIKDEKERKLELEDVKRKLAERESQIESLLKRDAERESKIESLLTRDAEREVKLLELGKKNETMEKILLEYTQEFKLLKARVEKQDEEVLRLKESAESEQAGEYSSDEQG